MKSNRGLTSPGAGFDLTRLIGPVEPAAFLSEHWECQPLCVNRDEPDYWAGLLSADDIDRLLSTDDRARTSLNIVNADEQVEQGNFAGPDGTVDLVRVYQLFDEGATIVLNHLHLLHEPLAAFCRALERDLSMAVQANVYLTPGNAQGFKTHYDTHDVFVVQLEGSKRWEILGRLMEHPLRGQSYDSDRDTLGSVTETFELRAGDRPVPRQRLWDKLR